MTRTGRCVMLLAVALASVQGALGQRLEEVEEVEEEDTAASAPTTERLSEVCMGCICEASSSCDRTRGCANGVCGLFALTKPYWIDAGRPVISGDLPMRQKAFNRCAVDPFCAASAVHAYMKRYAKDCDGDGVVDCQDFAAIHTLGGEGCDGDVDTAFFSALNKCLRRLDTSTDATNQGIDVRSKP